MYLCTDFIINISVSIRVDLSNHDMVYQGARYLACWPFTYRTANRKHKKIFIFSIALRHSEGTHGPNCFLHLYVDNCKTADDQTTQRNVCVYTHKNLALWRQHVWVNIRNQIIFNATWQRRYTDNIECQDNTCQEILHAIRVFVCFIVVLILVDIRYSQTFSIRYTIKPLI